MSSSLASIERSQFGKDELAKRGVDLGFHRQIPPARFGESSAFYCILLRHQQRGFAGECQVLGGERVVVGKRMAAQRKPDAFQMRKEACGMADCGDRMHRVMRKIA